MPATDPVFDEFKRDLGRLRSEFAAFVRSRFELAEIELVEAIAGVRRLALAGLLAATLLAATLPLVASALAGWLHGRLGIAREGWQLAIAAGFAIAAVLVASIAWRRFVRRARSWRDSLDEIREDLMWLSEWTA